MDKTNVVGAAQMAGGGYLGYKAISHGLPRALGIRIEYHTTSKANAALIKKAGNILNPFFGGKNGWSQKVNCESYIRNSKNYIHITGLHPDSPLLKYQPSIKYMRTILRRCQNFMYRTVGNLSPKQFKEMFSTRKKFFGNFVKSLFKNDTKRFSIPGIDSYFNANFIPDVDDFALKTTEKLKVYNTRLSAMFAGLKKFGLKGMKENKGRVAAGIAIVTLGGTLAYKLIKSGMEKFGAKSEQNVAQNPAEETKHSV